MTGATINPAGSGNFTFDFQTNSSQLFFTPTYIFHTVAYGLNYASYGWWRRDNPGAPLVWGTFAAGSDKDFSLPSTGSATFCGFYSSWNNPPYTSGVGSAGQQIKILTTWQHTYPINEAKITTFTIKGIGAATGGGYTINSKEGTATVDFSTLGTGGLLNGGKATALVKFYGPGAIYVSGTFSGPWEGQRIAGAFVASEYPPNSC